MYLNHLSNSSHKEDTLSHGVIACINEKAGNVDVERDVELDLNGSSLISSHIKSH